MPTSDVVQTRTPTHEPSVDLNASGELAGYAPQYLRNLMFTEPVEDRPPLFKSPSGRWRSRPTEMRAWAERRRAEQRGDL